MSDEVDLLVVGGGPAGLAAAEAAAVGGASVLLVHRDREIGRPVRTSGASWKRDIDRLGIPASLYHPVERLAFAGPTTRVDVEFGENRPVVLDVTGTYCFLADRAAAAGARIELHTRFERVLSVGKERLTCTIEGPNGSRDVAARYVVDASGHRRAVLSYLGIEDRPDRVGIGAEVECENLSDDPGFCALFVGSRFAPAGYGWIFPTRKGTVRVGIGVIRPDAHAAPAVLLQQFLRSEEARGLGLRVGEFVEPHSGIIPADGPRKPLVAGRVIGVGDSVGQALPLVGEGIRYCIDAGRHAGRALRMALEDPRYAEAHLQRYPHWWDRTHRRAFTLAQRINRRISQYRDVQWDEKVALLELLNADMLAAFLRMEYSPGAALRFALRDPLPVLRYAGRRLKDRAVSRRRVRRRPL